MKRIVTTLLTLLFFVPLFGQGSDDACLYSQTYYQGTAKALGMGNALGAVGGDMTAACINPAGMGIYRSNEFTFTLGMLDNLQQSTYYGTSNSANKFCMNLPSVSYVGTKQRSNYRPLRFTQFGIGLTRTNDYNIHTFAKGLNPTSSKIDNYLSQIDGYSENDLQEAFPYTIYPAWQTYLIDLYEDEQGLYYSSPVPQGGIWQSQENTFKGRAEEWTFAGSANYLDKLFIGISANLAHIKRVGFIYHANNWFRFGAAFHSPTIFNFNESWQTETESKINWVTRKYISPESHYEYTFIKPLRWVGSMAFVIRQIGMISLDAEYTNFGAARFNAKDWDYSETNDNIKSVLGKTFNFRIGSEWNLGGSYLRFGGAYYGSPLGIANSNGSIKKASIGLGLPVSESTTFDFAYELTLGKTETDLYDAGILGIEPVTQRQFRNNLAVTLRVRY